MEIICFFLSGIGFLDILIDIAHYFQNKKY